MLGNSASCYVETPRLEGSGAKNDAKPISWGVNFHPGNLKIALQNRYELIGSDSG